MSSRDNVAVYRRRRLICPPSPTTDDEKENSEDAHRSHGSSITTVNSSTARNNKPGWIGRSLSSRSSTNARDSYAFSSKTSSMSGKSNSLTNQSLLSPNVFQKKRVAAPANFVQEQSKYFAEVDAFELEEETPSKERWLPSFERQGSGPTVPGVQFYQAGVLQAVQEDTPGESPHGTPLNAPPYRDPLSEILETPSSHRHVHISGPSKLLQSSIINVSSSEEKSNFDKQNDECCQVFSGSHSGQNLNEDFVICISDEDNNDDEKCQEIPFEQSYIVLSDTDEEKVYEEFSKSKCKLSNSVERESMVCNHSLTHVDYDSARCIVENDLVRGFEDLNCKDSQKQVFGPCIGMDLNLNALLSICEQTEPLCLNGQILLSSGRNKHSITKLGEGTFGEAFKGNGHVFKIVPMGGDFQVNGEIQKTCADMYTESLLTLTLNRLRTNERNMCHNFIWTKTIKVCQGSYGPDLINAWEAWDKEHTSENDHPRLFPDNQLYVLFVLEDGGKDLESFALSSYSEAASLLSQVTAALAVAEEDCELEHRDLHWGNVLLTQTKEDQVRFKLNGKDIFVKTSGILVNIIDFTLSRVHTGQNVLFSDLSADPALFEGQKGDVQAETYRRMLSLTKGQWDERFLKTNCFWIHYLIDLLLTKKNFGCLRQENRQLRAFKKRVVTYESAKDCLQDEFFDSLLHNGAPRKTDC